MSIAPVTRWLGAGLPLAAPLEFSLRTPRATFVLDPRLALYQPLTALLAQQLGRVSDLWVPPAFWRLLDGSDFFLRKPHSLCRWLGLGDDDAAVAAQMTQDVAQALAMWSERRATRDPTQIGLHWVGAETTEGLHSANAPRDLAQRFEALMAGWSRASDAGEGEGEGADDLGPASAGMDIAGECAALAVALDGCPVLTLGAVTAVNGPTAHSPALPALVSAWSQHGMRCQAWPTRNAATAPLAQWHWWQAALQAGALATASLCPPLALLRPVLPLAQWDGPSLQLQHLQPADNLDDLLPQDWSTGADFDAGEAWLDELPEGAQAASTAAGPRLSNAARAAGTWARAECLWLEL